MMSTRSTLLLCASCALALAACDRDEDAMDEEGISRTRRDVPAQISVREPSPSERERGLSAAPRPVPTEQVLTARRAEADFDAVGDAKLEVEAKLEETSDGVEVVIHVADAKPGTRSVRIYDRADCEDLDEKPLGEPLAGSNKQGDLGSVTIGPSGKGTLESKAFNTSLKPDDRASLLGKTIVVQERDGTSPKSDGDPIACAVIKTEAKLADKAGRMAEPN